MNFPPIEFHKFSNCKQLTARKVKNDEKGTRSVTKNMNLIKMISFLIPDVEIPKNLTNLLNESFYEIENFKVADLLAKNTINGYINVGDFFCVSVGSNFDNVNFSVSQKKLCIDIEQNLFYSLGAVHLSKFKKEVVNDMHKFEVDLSYAHLDKIKSELNSELIDKVRIFIAWHPTSENICPSSIAKYFSDKGYKIIGHKNKSKIEPQYGLKMPKIPQEIDEEEITSFSEELGMILLNCEEIDQKQDMIDIGRGKVIHWKGLITQNQLNNLIKFLQEIIENFPYIALSIVPYLKTVNCSPRTVIITKSDYHILQ